MPTTNNIQETWGRVRPLLFSKFTVCAFVATLVAVCVLSLKLNRVEAYFYDLRVRLKGEDPVDPRISLIALGQAENSSLESHIALLERLVREKPLAIGYFNRFDPSDVAAEPKLAERFVELANTAQDNGTRVYFGTDVDLSGEVLPPYPLSLLSHAPAFLHKDDSIFGEDKVVRRALLTVNEEPTLHLRLAYPELSRNKTLAQITSLHGIYFFKPAQVWHILIHYPGTSAADHNTFPTSRAEDVLSGKMEGSFAGKIILIDTVRDEALNDFVFTPYSRVTYTHSRLGVHAAILNTILLDNGWEILGWRFDYVLTIFLAFFISYMTMLHSPARGVAYLILLSCSLFLISLLLFKYGGLWLRLVHPMCAMFSTYYLIMPYRAILEYKMRWDVQQKHDVLVRVEEMKGNFLSLMSHDLKTPVARIQGLAELILKQGGLQDAQSSELKQIIQSTENLDKFISKILNLTKVESNEIKLNRKSKDINKIIEQCAQKLAFQAQQKGVTLSLKLEPLFPIQLDAALIIQVLSNIMDNAIKYSEPGGSVEVQSREFGDKVEVIVSDFGAGMDEEELSQLFTKFFRGKSHPGDPIKGSGLGLYLSKYFIELHQGNVEAHSEKGQGSRFTIQLPIHPVS